MRGLGENEKSEKCRLSTPFKSLLCGALPKPYLLDTFEFGTFSLVLLKSKLILLMAGIKRGISIPERIGSPLARGINSSIPIELPNSSRISSKEELEPLFRLSHSIDKS